MATTDRGFLRGEEFRVGKATVTSGQGPPGCCLSCIPFVEFSFLFKIIVVRAEDEFHERMVARHTG